MLKKLGLVAATATAGLLAAAPLAVADEGHGGQDCSVTASDGENAQGPVQQCNEHFGQGNDEGNTINGMELPALPLPVS